MLYLGIMLESGKGVPRDYAEAVKWWRKEAEQGYADAMYYLGGMYNEGKGVPQDYVEAHKWYNLAAAATFSRHETIHGTLFAHDAAAWRDLLARKMTAEQIAEAQRLAREWKPK
jgi:hypothetical protein